MFNALAYTSCVVQLPLLTEGVPRGVAESEASAWKGSAGLFTCHTVAGTEEQAKVIDLAYVNDDYCDCLDGSDEPGTSACAGSRHRRVSFHCRNDAFQGYDIASSRVNDNVCDCCDGSDERDGLCGDTCAVLAKQVEEANRAQRDMFESGARQRAMLVSAAEESLQEERSALQRSRRLLEDATTSRQVVEQQANAVIERESALREEMNKSAQQEAEMRLGLHLLTHERLLHMVVRLAREADAGVTRSILQLTGELQNINCTDTVIGCDPPSLIQSDEVVEVDELSSDERDSALSDVVEGEINELDLDDELTDDNDNDVDAEVEPEDKEVTQAKTIVAAINESFQQAQDFLLPDAVKFRDTLAELDKTIGDLESTVKEKTELVEETDYGPQHVWFSLRDTCFDNELHGYKWQFCPLKQVKQDTVSLGKFARWENDYSTMVFEGGTRCWNGPERSAEIHLECGSDAALVAVEEPSKCVYKGRFQTPLQCI